MPRVLTVTASPKNFRITIPDEAKVTFGPWSPSTGEGKYAGATDRALNGTLRIYATKSSGATLLGVFSGVTSFREDILDFETEEIIEQGSTVWKSDKKGYRREDVVQRESTWDNQIGSGETPGEDEPEV